MRAITIVLTLFAFTLNAQVKVNEIRMKFGSEYHKAKEPDVIFPVMSTGSKIVDDKMNLFAIKKLTGEDSVTNFSTVLFRSMNEGLSELDYTITFNTNDILSYRLDALGCGAYCESFTLYFNFDLRTGEPVSIQDVISSEYLDSFRAIVFRDKVNALKMRQQQNDSLFSSQSMDSSDYDFASNLIRQCAAEVNVEKFLLHKNSLQIIDNCEFPHVAKALQPEYDLKYIYDRIGKFIKWPFLAKLKKASH